jgi:hypothetical protein
VPASRLTPVRKDRGTLGEVPDFNGRVWNGQATGRARLAEPCLLHEFLGNENIAEHTRESDNQNHLQHDAGTGDIAADLTESTTPKRLHYCYLQIDLSILYFFTQLPDFKLENANFVAVELMDTGMAL